MEGQLAEGLGRTEKASRGRVGSRIHRLVSFSLVRQREKGRGNDIHNTWELHIPIAVESNFVNRVIVSRNSGSSDSPSVVMISATFKASARRSGVWTVKSVGTISSASLSTIETGIPEFVNRIYFSFESMGEGKNKRIPSRACPESPASPASPQGEGNLTPPRLVRR